MVTYSICLTVVILSAFIIFDQLVKFHFYVYKKG